MRIDSDAQRAKTHTVPQLRLHAKGSGQIGGNQQVKSKEKKK